MRLSRPTVLILSTNPAFARELAAHWPAGPNPPEFTVLDQSLFRDLAGTNYDLAIADSTSAKTRAGLKQALLAARRPAIVVYSDVLSDAHSGAQPDHSLSSSPERDSSTSDCGVIELSSGVVEDGKPLWPVVAGLLGREILRRCRVEERARDAEAVCATVQGEATLGRYVAEMRHNINNALTSVLGNAELLTLEPGLPSHVLSQAETIFSMALRLHEVFRRFASIEEELSVAARQSGKELAARSAAGAR